LYEQPLSRSVCTRAAHGQKSAEKPLNGQGEARIERLRESVEITLRVREN